MRLCTSFLVVLCLAGSLVVTGCGPSYMSERSATNSIEEDDTYEDQVNPEGFADADDEGEDMEEEEE